ncbi:Multidrug resistance-associated protein 1 [Penicillium rolfsii]|nr:Multidrug resistance-associated protein 1 [Penicillium rolfsii]
MSTLGSMALFILSFFEHRRTVRPSSAVAIYVALSAVNDFVILTMPTSDLELLSLVLVSIRLVLEISLLVAESQNKVSILKPVYKHLPPEELTGVFGRALFWWIHSILKDGYRGFLMQDDLTRVDRALSSKIVRKRLIRAWNQRRKKSTVFQAIYFRITKSCLARPETNFTLPRVLLGCFRAEFLAPILPRLFLMVFRYAQPVLISVTIGFVRNRSSQDKGIKSGYWLIVFTTLIYCGLAVSTSSYRHNLNRLQMMTRGAIIGLIHARSLTVETSYCQDGRALTLMSADVDSIETFAEMIHETWAQIVEVLVGTILLARQIGWLAPMPLFIVFGCSRMSLYVAKNLQTRQKDWSAATQDRLAMISAILGGIKSMKVLGLEQATSSLVSSLRAREIAMSIRLRWIMVAYNASANALGIFSPVLTLVLFALSRDGQDAFNADVVFTTIALLGLVTHPANMIMTIIPRAVASLANFERIQAYLTQEALQYQRLTKMPTAEGGKYNLQPGQRLAIVLENIKIQLRSSSRPVLEDVSFHMSEGSIFVCSGAVGSGKSTLAMAILGEIIPTQGTVAVADRRIAFCSSSVWLPNGSIRAVICGGSTTVDMKWYQTVIKACCLNPDLDSMVDGDMTLVGSGGMNLSGGQKSRIVILVKALARAVYSRCHIMVLDDPFSALDGTVESNIIDALLGPEGLLRKLRSTVFLVANGDQVVLLSDTKAYVLSPLDNRLQAHGQMKKVHLSQNTEATERPGVEIKSQADGTQITDAAVDASRRIGDLTLYGKVYLYIWTKLTTLIYCSAYYFQSIGMFNILLMASCTAIYAFCLNFSQYILKWWIDAALENSWSYILSYLSVSIGAWTATNGTMSTHIVIAPRSGSALHAGLLTKVMKFVGYKLDYKSEILILTVLRSHTFPPSNMVTSFHATKPMLNFACIRFAQDIQLVDKQLPPAFANLSNQIFKLIMHGVILFVVEPIMALTLPFCTVCVYFIQRVYLRTSRQLRFIELESKSHLYASFIDTVGGIATIRAFGWQKLSTISNIEKLDISQSPVYLLMCLQRWLNVVLDFLIAAIAVALITWTVVFRGTATGTDIGIALNMIIAANTTLLRLVETWTTLETSLGAVARLRSVDQETPTEDQSSDYSDPSLRWPEKGSLEIKHLSAGYSSQGLAIRDVNMNIKPSQSIILCGRTGSSLFLALLRLLDTQFGSIEVDGVDICHLPVHFIRRRCFIAVPQDPFMLPGASVRFNLDPYDEHEDDMILEVLAKTGLWLAPSPSQLQNASPESTNNLLLHGAPHSGFLSQPLSLFLPGSTGQIQMFSFAQALLRAQQPTRSRDSVIYDRKPIILLDEAGSSFDLETQAKMQKLMKEHFIDHEHTVISIAHRLINVGEDLRPEIESVLWMKDGRLDEPHVYSEEIMHTGSLGDIDSELI